MFVEGSLRWQVTEDCPWDLLMALAIRDLAGLTADVEPLLPPVVPAPAYLAQGAGRPHVLSQSRPARTAGTPETSSAILREQWNAWWKAISIRERRSGAVALKPPHFTIFDRALELQDVVADNYSSAADWADARRDEFVNQRASQNERRVADIVDVVHEREHELRRQAAFFRLDINILPLARPGAWIVAPHTVVASASFRADSTVFRQWFGSMVAALV